MRPYAYAIILNLNTVYGPFATNGEAVAYARANFAYNDWTVVTLVNPQVYGEQPARNSEK